MLCIIVSVWTIEESKKEKSKAKKYPLVFKQSRWMAPENLGVIH